MNGDVEHPSGCVGQREAKLEALEARVGDLEHVDHEEELKAELKQGLHNPYVDVELM